MPYKNRIFIPSKRASARGSRAKAIHPAQSTGPVAMPTDYDARKALPIVTGCLDYFPDALLDVAACSQIANEQHNPGEPLHWAREKSTDEVNTLVRHLMQRGSRDNDGIRHSAKVAWRALANLQKEIEAEQSANNCRPASRGNASSRNGKARKGGHHVKR